MSCGGRVYKGDTIVISVPFDVEDYENLVITYTTTGDAKVVKTEDEVTIEDGFITYVSDGGELDLLPDGVIYYTISYEVDGVDHVESTNTPLYLKTPAGYSGKTADDIYQDGYEAGLNDCSGTSCMLYAGEYVLDSQFDGNSGVMYPDAGYNGFNSFLVTDGGYGQAKFESGYTAGQADCSGSTCNLQDKTVVVTADTQTVTPDQGYDGMGSVNIDANSYGQDMYTSGWTDGHNTSCDLTEGEFMLSNGWDGDTTLYPDSADGFSSVRIVDNSYGQEKFDSGHTAGVESGWSAGWNSGWTDGYNSGVTTEYGDAIHNAYESGRTAGLEECSGCVTASYAFPLTNDWNGSTIIHPSDAHYGYEFEGFSEVFIYDDGYGQAKYDSGHTAGVESGWSAGWNAGWISGSSSTDCGEAVEEAFGLGYESGYTDGQESCDCSAAYGNGYNDGQNGVIKSFLAENDTDYVIAYYYNPTDGWMYYAITGVYMSNDGQSTSDWVYGYCSFSAMSINGGPWEAPVFEHMLGPGWTQIRFAGAVVGIPAAFSMQATSAKTEPFTHLDGLKAVSLPSSIHVLNDTHAFTNNTSLRILSSSLNYVAGDTLTGTDGLNTVISHYKGDSRITMNPNGTTYNGVFFYPIGYDNTIPNQGRITSWSQIGLF